MDTVRTSLPYAYDLIARLATELHAGIGEFTDNRTPPPSEQERGRLLRALAGDAIRGGLERHFGVTLAFQNCHRVASRSTRTARNRLQGQGLAPGCTTSSVFGNGSAPPSRVGGEPPGPSPPPGAGPATGRRPAPRGRQPGRRRPRPRTQGSRGPPLVHCPMPSGTGPQAFGVFLALTAAGMFADEKSDVFLAGCVTSALAAALLVMGACLRWRRERAE